MISFSGLNHVPSNEILGQCLDEAIARLRSITDRIEQCGDEVEPGPTLVRLLAMIEHVEAILDRNLSPEIVNSAAWELKSALQRAAHEIEVNRGSIGHAVPHARMSRRLLS